MLPVATLWKARTGDSNREERKNKLRNRDSTRQPNSNGQDLLGAPGGSMGHCWLKSQRAGRLQLEPLAKVKVKFG